MRMHLVLGKRSKRRSRKAEVPICASDIETMPLTPPHVQPTLEYNPVPNPRRSIAPPIISTPKTSAPAPFPPASGLDHMGARHHLPARRSGGSSSGVCHVDDSHRQRPRYSAGLLIHESVPRHSGGVRAFARLLPRVDSALGRLRLRHLPSSARLPRCARIRRLTPRHYRRHFRADCGTIRGCAVRTA